MSYKLSELVTRFGGQLVGEDITIEAIRPTNLAEANHITFISDSKFKKMLANCNAGAIIITSDDAAEVSMPKIITDNPYYYFSQVSNLFNPRRKLAIKIEKSVFIDASSVVGENAAISHNVVIGANSRIGNNCQIFPNVVIGENVVIGNDVTIYPSVTIYDNVSIGNECVFHSGGAIGSDGFGNAKDSRMQYHRIPQIGGLLIGNRVEIGSNTTIDCGTFEPTIIEDGARIDNLVQIAHNVKIGAHTGIASQVGIAGNSKIGKHCMLAGNAGIADHVEICDYAVIGGSSNVGKNVTKPGLYSSGLTVQEYKDWAKTVIHLRNLGKTNDLIKELRARITKLEENIND